MTVLTEIRYVSTRDAVTRRYPHLTRDYVDTFLHRILLKARFVRNVPNHFDFERDLKDGKYLDLALAVEADYLVTRDKDMLELMTGIDYQSKVFRQRSRGLKILDPVAMLNTIFDKKEP